MNLLDKIKANAINLNKRIVLPEGEEERTLIAANIILDQKIAQIILLGNPDVINKKAKDLNMEHISKATIIDPLVYNKKAEYAKELAEIRKHKGLSIEQAVKLLENPLYLGVMMIKMGDADGEVAGAINATGNVLRPAFQIIKTLPNISVVSGAFIMLFEDKTLGDDGILVFADCAVNPVLSDRELAEIAITSANTARVIAGLKPRVAMLSFSTKGSAIHEMCDTVKRATQMAKEYDPELLIDGEMQVDAALVEAVGKLKCPGSPIAGNANVLVFPNMQSGNISYKLVQRLAGAEAIGPILQGLAAPINDLSRGCSVNDIVNLVAITANQAAGF